ncbi:hypothetical protein RRG08_005632 [Elysia crispata]|uniref:Uncharacterized protein n=1 Tax=Elysia crispata TaxID=231223 RepID=A0AAE0YXS5_9GAST|nr:hypothetical protein RRG08_005632 [Elysia crispata]
MSEIAPVPRVLYINPPVENITTILAAHTQRDTISRSSLPRRCHPWRNVKSTSITPGRLDVRTLIHRDGKAVGPVQKRAVRPIVLNDRAMARPTVDLLWSCCGGSIKHLFHCVYHSA